MSYNRHSISPILLIAVGVVLTGPACAGRGGSDIAAGPQPTPAAVIDTVVVERESARLSELEHRVARLQLQVLEREAQLEELQRSRDAAVEEVVRVSARLQTSASRAEAASVIAEAEIALSELQAVEPGAAEIEPAARMIQQAAAAFDAENFGGKVLALLYVDGGPEGREIESLDPLGHAVAAVARALEEDHGTAADAVRPPMRDSAPA